MGRKEQTGSVFKEQEQARLRDQLATEDDRFASNVRFQILKSKPRGMEDK